MIDLKSVTEQYPDCLENSSKLRSYLMDLYPEEKREIFVVCKLFDLDINAELSLNNGGIDEITVNRFCNRLEEEYGISSVYTKKAINTWQQLYFAGYYYGLGQRISLKDECKNLREYSESVHNLNLISLKHILEDGVSRNEKFGTVVFTLLDDGKLFIRIMPIDKQEFFAYLHEYVNEMVKADNIKYIVISDDVGGQLVSVGFSKEDHIVTATEYKIEDGAALFYENDYYTYIMADFRNIGIISVSEILYYIFINIKSGICQKEDFLRYALNNATSLAKGLTSYYNEEYANAFQIFDKSIDGVCLLKPYFQYYLGKCFYEGKGVKQDCEIAVNLFKQAAKYNIALAEDRLADAYISGKGVESDFYAGIGWIMRSAEHGNSRAMAELTVIINEGNEDLLNINGVNPAFALKQALNGDIVACFSVGSMYAEIYKQSEIAIKWFDRSLELMEKQTEKPLYYIVKSYKADALYRLDIEQFIVNPKSFEYIEINTGDNDNQTNKKILCSSSNRIRECFGLIADILSNANDDLSKNNAAALYRQIIETAR